MPQVKMKSIDQNRAKPLSECMEEFMQRCKLKNLRNGQLNTILSRPLLPIPISAANVEALASPRRYRSAALTLASTVYLAFLDINTPPEAHWFVFFQCLLQGEHINSCCSFHLLVLLSLHRSETSVSYFQTDFINAAPSKQWADFCVWWNRKRF